MSLLYKLSDLIMNKFWDMFKFLYHYKSKHYLIYLAYKNVDDLSRQGRIKKNFGSSLNFAAPLTLVPL